MVGGWNIVQSGWGWQGMGRGRGEGWQSVAKKRDWGILVRAMLSRQSYSVDILLRII